MPIASPTTSGTLDFPIRFGSELRVVRPTIVSKVESGYVRARDPSPEYSKSTWYLNWPLASEDEWDALNQLFLSSMYGATAFELAPPEGGSNVAVRLVPNTYEYSMAGAGQYSMSCEVREF